MATQSGLMDRIPELENALAREREKTQAMGERLRLAEEELDMVVKCGRRMPAERNVSSAAHVTSGRFFTETAAEASQRALCASGG
ncbi:hypothetical protein HPB50_020116 [Hyalomma asiaticum]|uniref:Uncharacterized protein n=1 Tax=Hyalomma asiaticum TaxID=266040 RepID=A0ACB7S506_HYAAI|nr:hypothetical protein HPB50_020116 [Hyalomma asiaticum]